VEETMRTIRPLPGRLGLILVVLLIALTIRGVLAAEVATFPLTLKGTTLAIGPAADRTTLVAQLQGALADERPSVFTDERLQYDYIAVPGEGPVAVLVDFDRTGGWKVIRVEADLQQQNPVAQEVAAWLAQHVGRGRKVGKETVWRYGGMRFCLHEVRDAGEDSVYGITITRNRASSKVSR